MPNTKGRALPGAIYFYNRGALKRLVDIVVAAPEDQASDVYVAFIKPGHYRCNSDQILAYNHYDETLLKGDLISVTKTTVAELTGPERVLIGLPSTGKNDDNTLLRYLLEFVSDDLQMSSKITVFVAKNLRGKLVDDAIEHAKFTASLSPHAKE